MIDLKGPYRIGAFFIVVSALLHLAAPLVSGFAAGTVQLVPFALLFFAIAYGLLRGWRWLAYVAFVLLMIASCFAIAAMWTPPAPFAMVMMAIAIADWLAVVALFVALWRPHVPDAAVS